MDIFLNPDKEVFSKAIEPCHGFNKPTSILIRVVLPDPLGPNKPINWPFLISRLISSSIGAFSEYPKLTSDIDAIVFEFTLYRILCDEAKILADGKIRI